MTAPPPIRHAAGHEASALTAGRHAIGIVGDRAADVAAHAVRIAKEAAAERPVLLFNLLGDDVLPAKLVADDSWEGITEAARHGVSLARVARPMPGNPGISVVPGGAESPLQREVLWDRVWDRWIARCREDGTLCLIAAPADRDDVGVLLDRLDGIVVIGDAIPFSRARVLQRVRDEQQPRAWRRTPPRLAAKRARRRNRLGWGAGAVAIVAIAWAARSFTIANREVAPGPGTADGSVAAAALSLDVAGLVAWSVELASVNSAAGALLRVRQIVDSVPVPTYSATAPGATPAPWYLLLAGAYADVPAAESLLAALRDRGVIEPAAGRVVRTPYTWLIEERVPPDDVAERLFAWRQLGLPAYALWDTEGLLRIYAGAFETEAQARLFAPALDSLDIHATLVPRVGSIR